MASFRPVAVYGLTVPAGDMPIPAFDLDEYPATFRITMAAIDPSAKIEGTGNDALPRATLKMIRFPVYEDESDEDDEDDEDYDMANLLDDVASEEDDEEDDEEEEAEALVNGNGAKKSSKEKKAAAIKKLKEALASEEGMDVDDEEDDEEEDDEDEDDEDGEAMPEDAEEFVICTLDPTKQYQQTLDIIINKDEQVLFMVSGNYEVHLTGNVLVDMDEEDSDDEEYDEDESFDLSPDEDELALPDSEDESDELDDLEDSRITEVDSEEEAIPALIKAAESKKGKNKRAAEDSAENTPVKAAEAAPATEGLSKTQQKKLAKKLKNNAGAAVDVATEAPAAKEEPSSAKSDKKVQFSKTLIQGPTGSASPKPDDAKAAEKPKASLGVKVVQGVTIDDKKLGSGPVAKKGDKVSMRYIGKLDKDKKVFDSNKKGPPFSFKIGKGEVIRGWDIGIAGMSAGGERRLTIPAHLAYGSKSQSGIPANSTLIFDVKLLEIK